MHEAQQSPSVQLRAVASLALYRRGRRGDKTRDSLLRALDSDWSRFRGELNTEIMDALVTDWADDGELQDACWARVGSGGPLKYDVGYENARSMLMRLHRRDPRVPRWVQKQMETRDYFPFEGMRSGDALLEAILSNTRTCVRPSRPGSRKRNSRVTTTGPRRWRCYSGATRAKGAMLRRLGESGDFRFWPVWSLLHGWGMDDPEVAAALEPLPQIPPEERQHIAHHVPAIVGSVDESFRLLMEICDLPEVSRTDFVIGGFAALGNAIDDGEAVSAILPHVRKSPATYRGEGGLISRFHADARVKEFALERLREPWPPLAAMAGVYGSDAEIAPLILQRAAPLPTVLRRYIARRASQRFDDEPLRQTLQLCELETDEHAMVQATIGLSYAALATPGEVQTRTEVLRTQLHVIGPRLRRPARGGFRRVAGARARRCVHRRKG